MPGIRLLADLRVEFDGLLVRSPRDEDLEPLVRVYSDDFDLLPEELRGRGSRDEFRAWMAARISKHHQPVSDDKWKLGLIVEQRPGVVLGWATLEADGFTNNPTVESNSWVETGSRRQGHGTSIRRAVLSLAFDGLDAALALSRAEPINVASNPVSQKCGYQKMGTRPAYPEGGMSVDYVYWVLMRETWQKSADHAVIRGNEPFKAWLNGGPNSQEEPSNSK